MEIWMLTYEFIRLFIPLHPLLLKYRSLSLSSKQVLLSNIIHHYFGASFHLVWFHWLLFHCSSIGYNCNCPNKQKNVTLGESWSVREPIIVKLFTHKYIFKQFLKYNIHIHYVYLNVFYYLFKFYLLFSFH